MVVGCRYIHASVCGDIARGDGAARRRDFAGGVRAGSSTRCRTRGSGPRTFSRASVGKCNGARTQVWMRSCASTGEREREEDREIDGEKRASKRGGECVVVLCRVGRLRKKQRSGQAGGRASAGLAKRHSVKLTAII